MTKGIREFAAAQFDKLLPKVKEIGPTSFRRRVMDDIQQQFGVTVASAATAYNFVLKTKREQDPKSVEGIGRMPGDNQGTDNKPKADGNSKPSGRPEPPNNKEQITAGDAPQLVEPSRADWVTLYRVRDSVVVADKIDRRLAKDLVQANTGRGRARLAIRDNAERPS